MIECGEVFVVLIAAGGKHEGNGLVFGRRGRTEVRVFFLVG